MPTAQVQKVYKSDIFSSIIIGDNYIMHQSFANHYQPLSPTAALPFSAPPKKNNHIHQTPLAVDNPNWVWKVFLHPGVRHSTDGIPCLFKVSFFMGKYGKKTR